MPVLDCRYWYDALGRRVAKQVHGSATRYVHDGWQVIQELDAPIVATAAQTASDGGLANLAMTPDGALLYATYDVNGVRQNPTRLNLQPETTTIPEGFIADKGRANGRRTNGLSYGADIRHIQQVLDHEELETTKVYLRLVPGQLREDYDAAMPVFPVEPPSPAAPTYLASAT